VGGCGRPLAVTVAGFFVVGLAAAAPGARAADLAAGPDEGRAPAAGRLEARLGLGRRHDTLAVRDVRANAEGGALSDLAVAGAWFGGSAHVGVAARLAVQRFVLRDKGLAAMPPEVVVNGLAAAGGLALRAQSAGGRLRCEGDVGYGLLRLPVVFVNTASAGGPLIAGGALGAHGPAITATVALALAFGLGLELDGEALPLAFGARYDGVAVSPRRFAGRIAATVDLLGAAGARWLALAGYEVARATADGEGIAVRQVSQAFGVGLRATWSGASVPQARVRVPGTVRLGVRAQAAGGEGAVALPGADVEVTGGPNLRTDAAGEVVVGGAPGPRELRITAPGFEPAREVIAIPAEGEVAVELLLARRGPVGPTALSGLVRSDSGAPVAARVRVLELDLELEAAADGTFHCEVPPGTYTLTIEADGFTPQRKLVRAGPDEQRIFNIELQTEGK
jgi:hypothetical protein